MPILNENSIEFFSHSPDQTKRVGIYLGGLLKKGDTICFEGDLGTGKTTFVQGLVQGWGALNQVTSPTFVLINEYTHPDGSKMQHLDAYRLKNEYEAEMLDFSQILEDNILVVEWSERIKKILPEECLWIQMRWMGVEQRHLYITAHGNRHQDIMKKLRKQLYGAI
jgi:tRNA threonylcarbamoyladenosine biosynthesis protein TsaE